MQIIAQKSDNTNSSTFFRTAANTSYIDGISLNVALTLDNNLVVFNASSINQAVQNTIESSTYEQLQNYEIILLDNALQQLNSTTIKKDIYINITPFKFGRINEENIQLISERMNLYTDIIKKMVDKYPNLPIFLHSISRNIVTLLKQKISQRKIGFVIYSEDLNFIDVDYYIMTMNVFSDTIIDLLLKENKKVILYIHSDYYISYTYEHYLGEKSTPYLQNTFQKLGLLSNYPEIINKVFND